MAIVACATVACAARARAPALAIDAGELVLTMSDGRTLRGAALIGATFQIAGRAVRLEAVARDPDGPAVLHHFTVRSPDRPPVELCAGDAAGLRWALPVHDDRGRIELVCSSGAIAKCVRAGYPRADRSTAPQARALHEACIRMMRADYGGDGATATRDGTRIGFCDRAGVHPCRGSPSELEAAWFEGGAACVARPRFVELMTLDQLVARYPRFAGHVGAACTVATGAADRRVVLFSWVF